MVKYIELSALRTGEAFLILEWVPWIYSQDFVQLRKYFCCLLQTDHLCRLVRDTSLCKLQTNSCLPVVSAVPSIPQHEQEVMEIAAQLLQVGVQYFAELSESARSLGEALPI